MITDSAKPHPACRHLESRNLRDAQSVAGSDHDYRAADGASFVLHRLAEMRLFVPESGGVAIRVRVTFIT